MFEANVGQFSSQRSSLHAGPGMTPPVANANAVRDPSFGAATASPSTMGQPASPPAAGPAVVNMQLVGANPGAKATGVGQLSTQTNYFIGNDPSQWHTGVPNYTGVEYANVYNGINLAYYSNQGNLEHDFIVAPGANPAQISTRASTGPTRSRSIPRGTSSSACRAATWWSTARWRTRSSTARRSR